MIWGILCKMKSSTEGKKKKSLEFLQFAYAFWCKLIANEKFRQGVGRNLLEEAKAEGVMVKKRSGIKGLIPTHSHEICQRYSALLRKDFSEPRIW